MSSSVQEERHICKTCRKIMPADECIAHAAQTGHREYRPYFDEESSDEKNID